MTEPTGRPPEPPPGVEGRIAEELEQLAGVVAAAVWLRSGAEAREIYIAATPGASVLAIQRAAAEVLRRNGIQAEEDHIRIGRLDEALAPAPAEEDSGWQARFLILDGVSVERADSHVTCRVRLLRLGERFEGEARELDTETGRARAAARATLAAVEKASPASLGLEGVIIAELFSRRYVVVSIEASSARRVLFLSGILSVEPTRSVEEAATLATFRAVERFTAW